MSYGPVRLIVWKIQYFIFCKASPIALCGMYLPEDIYMLFWKWTLSFFSQGIEAHRCSQLLSKATSKLATACNTKVYWHQIKWFCPSAICFLFCQGIERKELTFLSILNLFHFHAHSSNIKYYNSLIWQVRILKFRKVPSYTVRKQKNWVWTQSSLKESTNSNSFTIEIKHGWTGFTIF